MVKHSWEETRMLIIAADSQSQALNIKNGVTHINFKVTPKRLCSGAALVTLGIALVVCLSSRVGRVPVLNSTQSLLRAQEQHPHIAMRNLTDCVRDGASLLLRGEVIQAEDPPSEVHSGTDTVEQPSASQGRKPLTFYVYRAQSKDSYPLENLNAADLAGVMWYLHNEVIVSTPRKYSIDRIRRYKLTLKNTEEFWNVHHRNFGAFLAFDAGRCTTPICGDVFSQYGFIVGCQVIDVKVAPYLTNAVTRVDGGCKKPFCNAPVWYALPGPCPVEGLMNDQIRANSGSQDVMRGKSAQCLKEQPGGRCDHANGAPDCTYSYEDAGEIMLDELVGIEDYNYFWNVSYSECTKALHDKRRRDPCIHHKEFDLRTDKGEGCSFWDGKADAKKAAQRMDAVRKLFKKHYPDMPADLEEPACDFDMYYDGEFTWPADHKNATPPSRGFSWATAKAMRKKKSAAVHSSTHGSARRSEQSSGHASTHSSMQNSAHDSAHKVQDSTHPPHADHGHRVHRSSAHDTAHKSQDSPRPPHDHGHRVHRKETCHSLGCGTRGKFCSCNSLCSRFNDCCEDFHKCQNTHPKFTHAKDIQSKETCTSLGCGGRGKHCACNAECRKFHDCCEDYDNKCQGHHARKEPSPKHHAHRVEAQPSPRRSHIPSTKRSHVHRVDPDANTCKELGCGARGNQCACTSQCTIFENCCVDYTDQCLTPGAPGADRSEPKPRLAQHMHAADEPKPRPAQHRQAAEEPKPRPAQHRQASEEPKPRPAEHRQAAGASRRPAEMCRDLGCGNIGEHCACTSQCPAFGNCCRDYNKMCASQDHHRESRPHSEHSSQDHHRESLPHSEHRQPESEEALPADQRQLLLPGGAQFIQPADTSACMKAQEECDKAVDWAMSHGIYEHPEWYNTLTPYSPRNQFTHLLAGIQHARCDEVCTRRI